MCKISYFATCFSFVYLVLLHSQLLVEWYVWAILFSPPPFFPKWTHTHFSLSWLTVKIQMRICVRVYAAGKKKLFSDRRAGFSLPILFLFPLFTDAPFASLYVCTHCIQNAKPAGFAHMRNKRNGNKNTNYIPWTPLAIAMRFSHRYYLFSHFSTSEKNWIWPNCRKRREKDAYQKWVEERKFRLAVFPILTERFFYTFPE